MQFALTLGSTMILARLLRPHDFGLVAMVLTVMGFMRLFRDAGLSIATVQRPEITHAQVSNLFWINAVLSGVLSLLVAACAPLIAWFYREPRLVALTTVLSATFFLTGVTVQHAAILNRQMLFRKIALIQIGSLLGGIIVGVVMAWFGYGCWSLVGMQLSTAGCGLLLTFLACRWRPQLPTRHSGMWPLLSFGANVSLGGLFYSLARGSDSLLIGRFYGAGAVGLYSRAGALLSRPIETFLGPLYSVFAPVLSRLQLEPERYRRTFLQLFEAIAVASFVLTGLCVALAEPLTLVVLGPSWEKAGGIFAALAFTALFYPLSNVCSWLFASQGRGREWLVANCWVSAAIFCSFLVGLPFGVTGVAASYSASGIFLLLPIMLYTSGHRGPVKSADLWTGFFKHLPVFGVVYGAALLARISVARYSPLLQLSVCVPVCLAMGGVFIYFYAPSRRLLLSCFDVLLQWRKCAPWETSLAAREGLSVG